MSAYAMKQTTIFLNLSIAIVEDISRPIDEIISYVRNDIEFFYKDRQGKVFSCVLDREQALEFGRAQTNQVEVLTPAVNAFSADVAAVLDLYGLTLPKVKRGEPEWRVPKEPLWGHVQGLPSLQGRLVLTNGIKAFVIQDSERNISGSQMRWADVHFDFFVPNKPEEVESFLPNLPRKLAKKDTKMEESLMQFD